LGVDDLALASDESRAVGGVCLGQAEVAGATSSTFTMGEGGVSVTSTEGGDGKDGLRVHRWDTGEGWC
jgi:hypothetical protein